MNKLFQLVWFCIAGLCLSAANAGLEVYSLTDNPSQPNQLKPKIYIVNNSSEAVSNFTVRYFFAVPIGATPILEDYYTPYCNVSLKRINTTQWYVEYVYTNYTLQPGATAPNSAGDAIGLHLSTWSNWDKSDDYSFENSTTFIKNEKIAVYNQSGMRIYGTVPPEAEQNTTDYTGLTVQVKNNGLYENNCTKPSIAIINSSAFPLASFTVWYYFTADGSAAPILDSWYTPDASASLVRLGGSLYAIVLNYNQFVLLPGARTPSSDGANVGVHYSNWSNWNKSDDYSECNSSAFVQTDKIVVKDAFGNVIYGKEPGPMFIALKPGASQTEKPAVSIKNTTRSVHFECSLPGLTMTTLVNDGIWYQILHAGSFMNHGKPGIPSLPAFVYQVAIPDGATASIRIDSSSTRNLQGYKIFPNQQFTPDGEPGTTGFSLDQSIYGSNNSYPASPVEIIGTTEVSGVKIAQIKISPVRFSPQSGNITASDRLSFTVLFDGGGNEATVDNGSVLPSLENSVANGEILKDGGNAGAGRGRILILTVNDFLNAANELAQWKRELGYTVTIDSRASWDTAAIRSVSHGTSPDYLILLGDHQQLPAVYYAADGFYDPHYTDLRYACTGGAGDYSPDMIYGRIPVSSGTEALQLVRKFINFEKKPVMNPSFYSKAMIATYFQDDNKDGYEDRRYSLTSFETSDYLSSLNYSVNKIFYTESYVTPKFWNKGEFASGAAVPANLQKPTFAWNGDKYAIANAINDGCFLAMHRDHGWESEWCMPEFTLNDISLLHNTYYPLILSIDCSTGRFSNNCFSERLLRKLDGGGIGVFGATAPSLSFDNEVLVEGLINGMFPDPGMTITEPNLTQTHSNATGIREIGAILFEGFRNIDGSNLNVNDKRYDKELYHCFGDPSLKIYTQTPQAITASYPFVLDAESQTLTITSINCGDGYATLSYNGSVLTSTHFTNGAVTLTLPASFSNAVLDLTISSTAPEYKPLIDHVLVGSETPQAPVAQAMIFTIKNNGSLEFDLTGTPELWITDAEIVSDPNYGTVTRTGLHITYTPSQGVHGIDRFTFRLHDRFGQVSNVADIVIQMPNSSVSSKIEMHLEDVAGADVVYTPAKEIVVLKKTGGIMVIPANYPDNTNISQFNYYFVSANSLSMDAESNLLIGGVSFSMDDPPYLRYGAKVPEGKWSIVKKELPGCSENYYTGYGITRLVPAADGAMIMTGTKTNGMYTHPNERSTPNDDAYVTKFDRDFNVIWENNLALSEADDFAHGVTVASNGDIIVTGYVYDVATAQYKAFLSRLDSFDGTVIWTKTYDQIRKGYRIVEASNGNIAMVGEDMKLMMTDPQGNVVWVKDYWQDEPVEYKDGFTLINTSDNKLLVAGSSKFMKLDYNGDIVWKQTIDGTVFGAAEADNGFALTGKWNDGKMMIVKTNSIGQFHNSDPSDNFDYNLNGPYNMTYYNSTVYFTLPPSAANVWYYLRFENNGRVFETNSVKSSAVGLKSHSFKSEFPNLTTGPMKISLVVGDVVKEVLNVVITDLFNYNFVVPNPVNTSSCNISYALPTGAAGVPVILRFTYDDGTVVDVNQTGNAGTNTYNMTPIIPAKNGNFTVELIVNGKSITKVSSIFMPPFDYHLTVPNPFTSTNNTISYQLPVELSGLTTVIKIVFPSIRSTISAGNATGLNSINFKSDFSEVFGGRTGSFTCQLIINGIVRASVTSSL